jgi:hypothetical protein
MEDLDFDVDSKGSKARRSAIGMAASWRNRTAYSPRVYRI